VSLRPASQRRRVEAAQARAGSPYGSGVEMRVVGEPAAREIVAADLLSGNKSVAMDRAG